MNLDAEANAEPTHPVRNAKYYLHDPMAIFLVENQLFKVHRHFLVRESEIFNQMFLCPPPSHGQDGSSDEQPITLDGVTAVEFERLHDYFYEEKFQRHGATLEEWIDLLNIAAMFFFDNIRQRAIWAIQHAQWPLAWFSPLDPVDQIVLAKKHNIPEWLRIGYTAICERGRALTHAEGEKLGMSTMVLLAEAREAVRNPHHEVSLAPSPLATPLPPQDTIPVESRLGTPNAFHHNRARVEAIVSQIFFPPPPLTE
ncbi:hypothetical protein FB45DRAFT_802028 [Roridomyces roridus]|uniref:BTB domain-containing protein n=1 Tax=Roridomyces roridus TaxID=1738132 RepID=A0AAD7BAI0_9AGAR|nr:hypothetical protein FB45DRAFT_802028 [Roridomyces roridus]